MCVDNIYLYTKKKQTQEHMAIRHGVPVASCHLTWPVYRMFHP